MSSRESMHKRVRWCLVKRWLELSFDNWRVQAHIRNDEVTPGDVIEFLFQRGLLKGKKWIAFIDSIPDEWIRLQTWTQPLRECFIPPNTFIGKENKDG